MEAPDDDATASADRLALSDAGLTGSRVALAYAAVGCHEGHRGTVGQQLLGGSYFVDLDGVGVRALPSRYLRELTALERLAEL